MGEILPKPTAIKTRQVRLASLLHDNPHYFNASERQRTYPDQSRLEQLSQWPEYVRSVREIRKGRHYADQLDAFLTQERTTPSDFQLVEAQQEVVEDIQEAFNDGLLHASVVMPTGAGKTAIFTKVAQALGLRTLIVTPSQIGVEQIQQTFEELGEGNAAGAVYTHGKDFEQQVTVTTYDSLRRNLASGSLPEGTVREAFHPEDYDLVILDEAHLSLTQDRIAIARNFQNCARLAFTATPVYNEEKEVEGAFGQIIHRMTIEEAVQSGLLAEKISATLVQTDIDLDNVRVTASGEYDETQLLQKINTPERNNAAVDVYNEHFLGEQAIIRCANIEHAEAVQRTFEERFRAEGTDLKVAVVHSGMKRPEIDTILAGVKNGTIDIVCSAKLLDFAFDAPGVSLAFNLAPTLSRVTEEQFGGRVVRKDRASGQQKHARIVDFLDKDTRADRAPIIYAQILGVPSITSRHYIEPRRTVKPASSGIITGTTSSTWRYIDDPTEIRGLIRKLDIQDVNVDITDFITFPEILAGIPGERREKLVRRLADRFRSSDYRRFRIPGRKIPSTLYPPTVMDRIPKVLEREYAIAPDDWMTETMFAAQVGRKWQTFGALIDKDLELNPDRKGMVGMYANKRGRSRYLSPQYQAILSQELHRPVLPRPEGYNTVGTKALQEATGFAGMETMLRAADRLVEAHNRPDWIIKGFWTGERVVNLYADELRELLRTEREAQLPFAPEDWGVTIEILSRGIAGAENKRAFAELVRQRATEVPDASDFGWRRERTRGVTAVYMTQERGDAFLREFRSRNDELPVDNRVMVSSLVAEIVARTKERPETVLVRINRWINSMEGRGEAERKRDFGDVFNHESKKMGRAVTQELAERMRQDRQLFGK